MFPIICLHYGSWDPKNSEITHQDQWSIRPIIPCTKMATIQSVSDNSSIWLPNRFHALLPATAQNAISVAMFPVASVFCHSQSYWEQELPLTVSILCHSLVLFNTKAEPSTIRMSFFLMLQIIYSIYTNIKNGGEWGCWSRMRQVIGNYVNVLIWVTFIHVHACMLPKGANGISMPVYHALNDSPILV